MASPTVNPILYALSRYPGADLGSPAGYDDRMRLPLGFLDFGYPDQVKTLESVTLTYQSLREVPWTITVWREQPLTGSGDESESVELKTEALAANEPGVFWSEASPAWSTAPYAADRLFRAKGYFTKMAGQTLFVGVESGIEDEGSDITPVRLISVEFGFNLQVKEWLGSGVVK